MRNALPLAIILVSFAVASAGCYKESNYDPSDIAATYNDSISVSPEPASIPADSLSLSKIVVKLPYDADSTKSTVTFRTDLGTFIESGNQTYTVTAKNNSDTLKKIAIATLKSGTVTGTAHVQCSFTLIVKTLTVTFTNAYPDFLNLSSSALSVRAADNATGEVTFTCKLFKTIGVPSQRNQVTMSVTDTLGAPIGAFRVNNNLSDATGNTQFVFVLGDISLNKRNYVGPLTATAKAASDNSGDSVSASIQFFSTP